MNIVRIWNSETGRMTRQLTLPKGTGSCILKLQLQTICFKHLVKKMRYLPSTDFQVFLSCSLFFQQQKATHHLLFNFFNFLFRSLKELSKIGVVNMIYFLFPNIAGYKVHILKLSNGKKLGYGNYILKIRKYVITSEAFQNN